MYSPAAEPEERREHADEQRGRWPVAGGGNFSSQMQTNSGFLGSIGAASNTAAAAVAAAAASAAPAERLERQERLEAVTAAAAAAADARVRTRAAAMEAISLSHGALSSKLDGRREREVTTNCETLTHSAAIDTAKEAAASVTGLRVGSVLNDGRREQSEDARAHGAASVSAADSTEQASSAFAEAHFNSIKQLQDARALISTYECARGVAPRQPEASTIGASVMIATGLASSALYKRTLSEASRAAAASTEDSATAASASRLRQASAARVAGAVVAESAAATSAAAAQKIIERGERSAQLQVLSEQLGAFQAGLRFGAQSMQVTALQSASMSSVSAEKRAAFLAAETVLLKLDAARDRLTAVELQARLREVQEQRAAELSDAVANHDAESALSALIAAEADGLITPDFVDLINSSARRVTAHKRGAEASDAERAFYLSLYITSHEAARLVSDFFGGPSSDAMQGWVGSYPHMKPGTKETDVEANIEHNIGVWTRQGVDVCDEDVEMYSCDDATATQARLNAGVVDGCIALFGLSDGPFYLDVNDMSDDEIMDQALHLITNNGLSTSLHLHMMVPQHHLLSPLPVIAQETNNKITSEDMLSTQRMLLRVWHRRVGKPTLRQSSADGAGFARKTTARLHLHSRSVAASSRFILQAGACGPSEPEPDEAECRVDVEEVVQQAREICKLGDRGDHAAVLGFTTLAEARQATGSELKSRYRRIARRVQPGKMPHEHRDLATAAFQLLSFAFGKLAQHPACTMHAPEFRGYGMHLITSDPMHCRWRLRRQYLRTRAGRGGAVAVLFGCTNPTLFATAARSYGARIKEKDFAYENKQNELGCFRLAGLSRDGHKEGGCNYLERMWEERASLEPRSLCADVLFWRFFRRCGFIDLSILIWSMAADSTAPRPLRAPPSPISQQNALSKSARRVAASPSFSPITGTL